MKFKFKKFPLRDIKFKMWFIVDSRYHGLTNGKGKKYEIWININDEPEIAMHTIAHELAHIHLFRYHKHEHGEDIFYKHNKMHRKVEAYYMEHWFHEIEKLYNKLLDRAEIDIMSSRTKELKKMVRNYERCKKFNKIFS